MTPRCHEVIRGRRANVTYFMTPKARVTLVVSLNSFMTPKGHGVIRVRRDLLYDPKVTVTFVVGLT